MKKFEETKTSEVLNLINESMVDITTGKSNIVVNI